MAGVGLDAMVVNSLSPALKKVLREAAFAVHGVATFFRSDFPLLRVETAEQTAEGYFVVIGNSANYGGAFGITTKASMRDGLLDVCVLQTLSPLGTAYYWLAALVESHLRHPKVQYWRTQSAARQRGRQRRGRARADGRRGRRHSAADLPRGAARPQGDRAVDPGRPAGPGGAAGRSRRRAAPHELVHRCV